MNRVLFFLASLVSEIKENLISLEFHNNELTNKSTYEIFDAIFNNEFHNKNFVIQVTVNTVFQKYQIKEYLSLIKIPEDKIIIDLNTETDTFLKIQVEK